MNSSSPPLQDSSGVRILLQVLAACSQYRLLFIFLFISALRFYSLRVLVPLIAIRNEDVDDAQMSILYACWGIGSIVWSIVGLSVARQRGVLAAGVAAALTASVTCLFFYTASTLEGLCVLLIVLEPFADGMLVAVGAIALERIGRHSNLEIVACMAFTAIHAGGALGQTTTFGFLTTSDDGAVFGKTHALLLAAVSLLPAATMWCSPLFQVAYTGEDPESVVFQRKRRRSKTNLSVFSSPAPATPPRGSASNQLSNPSTISPRRERSIQSTPFKHPTRDITLFILCVSFGCSQWG